MEKFIIDAGPFIHLSQIGEITLLEKFPSLYTPDSVISEINLGEEVPIQKIHRWKNLKILRVREKTIPEIDVAIKDFGLHAAEREAIYLAHQLKPCIVLTDDLNARRACENLLIEVHGTVGIIAYAFHNKWLSFKRARQSLLFLYRKSSLFVTSAIIERAIEELRRSV